MGVGHNAYIGPYLRVTATIKDKIVDGCADHNFPDDAAYCPKCGKSRKDRMRKYEDDGTSDDWEQNYQRKGKNKTNGGFWDYLTSTSSMSVPDIEWGDGKKTRTYIYLPNRYYKEMGLPSIEGGKYSEEEVPFDELNIPEITQKFTEFFKEEIDYLKQWFGVEVKFGYIAWCS